MKQYGYVKVGAATPELKVANPDYNYKKILELIAQADQSGVSVLAFPELSVTGYTCGDLFLNKNLIEKSEIALKKLVEESLPYNVVTAVGMPVFYDNELYNGAVVFFKGRIFGIVTKKYLPDSGVFNEKRYFSVCESNVSFNLCGMEVPMGNILFDLPEQGITLGIEIGSDLYAPISSSTNLALEGADVILHLSADPALAEIKGNAGKFLAQQSKKLISAHVYTAAGVWESTTDLVFSGEKLICENGVELAKSQCYERKSSILFADLDFESIRAERMISSVYKDCKRDYGYCECDRVEIKGHNPIDEDEQKFSRNISAAPFIPAHKEEIDLYCNEILNIQAAGLCKRVEHTNTKKLYIGISGGLDSTWALIVCVKAFELLSMPLTDITGITMPGFGTTGRTYDNAMILMKEIGITMKEIDIKDACLKHFNDIDHDPAVRDTSYENVQARERTQVLMDIANKNGGLVIGTGDLSELALGWCTYNGDHMSMYGVNASLPKTSIQYLIEWHANSQSNENIKRVLTDVLNTPISPELLPPDENGNIAQQTENAIGPYELHDFFLYYMIRYGMGPQKILFIAKKAFMNEYDEETIKKWLKVFLKRFFSQQFKRSCIPDGPKIGLIGLSPRADWKMPCDADVSEWLNW